MSTIIDFLYLKHRSHTQAHSLQVAEMFKHPEKYAVIQLNGPEKLIEAVQSTLENLLGYLIISLENGYTGKN